MDLAISTKTTHYVDFITWRAQEENGDWGLDLYLQEVFGLDDTPELLEANNDTDHSFNVGRPEPGSYKEKAGIEAVKTLREKGWIELYNLGDLLNYMVDAFDLPEGNYVVRVSW